MVQFLFHFFKIIIMNTLGAAAVGVVIGMLVAPDKGTETRKRIQKTAGNWVDDLLHFWEKGKRTVDNAAEVAKEQAHHAKAVAEEKVNKIKESFSSPGRQGS